MMMLVMTTTMMMLVITMVMMMITNVMMNITLGQTSLLSLHVDYHGEHIPNFEKSHIFNCFGAVFPS